VNDALVALIGIVVTLTIFCLGVAFHAGAVSARVAALESRLDRFESLVLEGLDKVEKLIVNGNG